MIPVAWVLMKKRKYKEYKVVFGKIKEHAMAKGVILNPRQIMTDMELGAMKAFKYHWTSASIKACLFHIGQAWFKNWLSLVYNLLMAMIQSFNAGSKKFSLWP